MAEPWEHVLLAGAGAWGASSLMKFDVKAKEDLRALLDDMNRPSMNAVHLSRAARAVGGDANDDEDDDQE